MTGSFNHLLTLTIVSLFAYLIPDLLKCRPIYDSLLRRLLEKQSPGSKPAANGEKVLIDSVISHGSAAENRTVSDIVWPEHCLVVSVMRGEEELVPKGNTVFRAGDRIILLCDENYASDAHRTLEHQCQRVRVGQKDRRESL